MTILLTEIYDVTLKKINRDAAKNGFIRPTIGESFATHKDFKEIVGTPKSYILRLDATPSASSYYDYNPYYHPSYLISPDNTYGWMPDTLDANSGNCWAQYDYGEGNGKVICKYMMSSRYGAGGLSAIRDWAFKASNDGENWITLDTRSSIYMPGGTAPTYERIDYDYIFSNRIAYRYYRLNPTAGNGAAPFGFAINELMLYEGIYE